MDYVMNSSDDEDVEPSSDEEALVMAERLNNRRVLLAAFLKLCMFQVIEPKMAAPVWGHFISVSEEASWSVQLGGGKGGGWEGGKGGWVGGGGWKGTVYGELQWLLLWKTTLVYVDPSSPPPH